MQTLKLCIPSLMWRNGFISGWKRIVHPNFRIPPLSGTGPEAPHPHSGTADRYYVYYPAVRKWIDRGVRHVIIGPGRTARPPLYFHHRGMNPVSLDVSLPSAAKIENLFQNQWRPYDPINR